MGFWGLVGHCAATNIVPVRSGPVQIGSQTGHLKGHPSGAPTPRFRSTKS
ncbi:MAG: hypothetical protein ACI8UD_003894 [Planctomycetota bacterium]